MVVGSRNRPFQRKCICLFGSGCMVLFQLIKIVSTVMVDDHTCSRLDGNGGQYPLLERLYPLS